MFTCVNPPRYICATNDPDTTELYQTPPSLAHMYWHMGEIVGTVLPRCIADIVARYVVGYTWCRALREPIDLPPEPSQSNLYALCAIQLGAMDRIEQYVIANQATWECDGHEFPAENIAGIGAIIDQLANGLAKGINCFAVLRFPWIAVVAWDRQSILIIDVVTIAIVRHIDHCHEGKIRDITTNPHRTHLFWTTTEHLFAYRGRVYICDLTQPNTPTYWFVHPNALLSPITQIVTHVCAYGENYIASLYRGGVTVSSYSVGQTKSLRVIGDQSIDSMVVAGSENGSRCLVTGSVIGNEIRVWDLDTGVLLRVIMSQHPYIFAESRLCASGFAVWKSRGLIELYGC
jgi:hypothetical protein